MSLSLSNVRSISFLFAVIRSYSQFHRNIICHRLFIRCCLLEFFHLPHYGIFEAILILFPSIVNTPLP